ncbi:MAG TPA: hypothetical protein VJN18_04690 [Polyangiaceae bacterium]|nr:hypothetical protein [Polyangiaceae bacterium]
MTHEELATYLESLPPEVRAAMVEAIKPIGDYATRAVELRERFAREFPGLNPPLRAALSLALARFR